MHILLSVLLCYLTPDASALKSACMHSLVPDRCTGVEYRVLILQSATWGDMSLPDTLNALFRAPRSDNTPVSRWPMEPVCCSHDAPIKRHCVSAVLLRMSPRSRNMLWALCVSHVTFSRAQRLLSKSNTGYYQIMTWFLSL